MRMIQRHFMFARQEEVCGRTLTTAYIVWDLKRQKKVTDEEATRARVETLSERDALGWVPPGDYTVTLELGAGSLKTEVNVRKERRGVKRVEVRK
jgi:hypothetical protein